MVGVTVITPCLPSGSLYLKEAAHSVAETRKILVDTSLEWILVIDGPGQVEVPKEADLVIEIPRNRGVSVARNYALGHASGKIVVNLDADDMLNPSGVESCIRALEDGHGISWVAANRLLMTGEKTVHWHGDQYWPTGSVAAEWTAPMAFHSNTLVVYREDLLAIGGWPAIGACEDLAVALMLSERGPGLGVKDVLIKYRAWEGQTTSMPNFRYEQLNAYKYIEKTINSLRSISNREPISHPLPLGGIGRLSLGK